MPTYYKIDTIKKFLSETTICNKNSMQYKQLQDFSLNLPYLKTNIEKQQLKQLITSYNDSVFDQFNNLIASIKLFNKLDNINDEEKESHLDLTVNKQGIDLWLNIMDESLGREQRIKIKQTDTIHDIKEKIQKGVQPKNRQI